VHKHEIRKVFQKQLAQIWDIVPSLREYPCIVKGASSELSEELKDYPNSEVFRFKELGQGWTAVDGITLREFLAHRHRRGPFRFVPLVREELQLLTSIEVLFLRADKPGTVLSAGDIDGRIKTLFDALQIPKDEQVAKSTPDADEDPFYVLVEDDSLITHLSVETDRLLEPTGKSQGHPQSDARLIITVGIRPYVHNGANEGFA
jgi:hypothetical protein